MTTTAMVGLGAMGQAVSDLGGEAAGVELRTAVDEKTGVRRSAIFSPDGRFRYWLERRWGDGPLLLFLMQNPSKAGHLNDDQTVRRGMHFARREGFAGMAAANLYARVETDSNKFWMMVNDPACMDIYSEEDNRRVVVGPHNDALIRRLAPGAGKVVVAWGAAVVATPGRVAAVRAAAGFSEAWCLGRAKNGEPRHPSRLGNDVALERFDAARVSA